jgi:dipeptidase
MCDTFVALGSVTVDGFVIFGKNSDREPNEAQEICLFSAADYAPGEQVQCTYRSVPQVARTHAVLLSKPFWMWGAEMGLNDHGVAIGNEAVFTRIPYDTSPGLTGMDLLRLALERSETARAALDVITDLLEEYGQGGNCGFTHPFYYHNSFILADAGEAWVLETAGKHWAAERVRAFRSISNGLTIGRTWDLASPGLVAHAVERGWCKGEDDFDFARCYSDFLYTRLSDSRKRQVCTTQMLQQAQGKLDAAAAMAILRAHALDSKSSWSPDHGLLGAEVCMHAGAGPVRASQSVGSLVAQLNPGGPLAWVTATSAPCTGLFKPVWFDAGLPEHGPRPTGTYDAGSLWWQHERLHRAILQDFANRLALIAPDRDQMEAAFLAEARLVSEQSPADRQAFSERCFANAADCEDRWLQRVNAQPVQRGTAFYQRIAWNQFNRQARLVK